MASLDPDEIEKIEIVVRRLMRSYYGPMVAQVTAVSSGQRGITQVDILPMQNIPVQDREDLTVEQTKQVEIPNVPVAFLSSSASDGSIRLESGDTGIYLPMMWSTEALFGTDNKGHVDTPDPDLYPYNSGVFIPMRYDRSISSAAQAADRTLGGTTLVGDPDTAQSVAYKGSVQSAIDTIWGAIAQAAVDTAPGPTPPQVNGTDHLKGS